MEEDPINRIAFLIHDIDVERDENVTEEGTINRIAEEIIYLSGKEGNISSIQVDGLQSAATDGIVVHEVVDTIYLSLTGDQCVIENINVK